MGSGIRYTPEFKIEAVRLVRESTRPSRLVAQELGINPDTLRGWVNRSSVADMDDDQANERDSRQALRAAKRRIAELEAENDFLKKAAAFFAAERNHKNGLK